MQNSKTTTAVATTVKPTNATPVSTTTDTSGNNDTAKVQSQATKNDQLSFELMKTKSKTLYEKFENAKVFNAKKAFYDDFKDRLENVKEFRQRHDGSGLVLTIKNQSTAKTVEFQNQSLILSFLDEAIKQGDLFLEGCEIEMMNLEV
jgi:hypothetical protein